MTLYPFSPFTLYTVLVGVPLRLSATRGPTAFYFFLFSAEGVHRRCAFGERYIFGI